MGMSTTWVLHPATDDYNDSRNWSSGVPTYSDTAFFARSSFPGTVQITTDVEVSQWVFKPSSASLYWIITNGTPGGALPAISSSLYFDGNGIVNNGGAVEIDNFGVMILASHSTITTPVTASKYVIVDNEGSIAFNDTSSAGEAEISDRASVFFSGHSSAGDAFIGVSPNALTAFSDFANGGNAVLDALANGVVSFIGSEGPAGNHRLTAGSIEGAGRFLLGTNRLTVGGDGHSATVSGSIEGDGSLVKVGHGRLRLSGDDNYLSGGMVLKAGTLDLASVDAAGSGAITFAGAAHLKLEDAALAGNVFDNPIHGFGRGDIIDLAGLHFHPGARVTYHPHTHQLAVHSGTATDVLTLVAPHGTHFTSTGDGHGGTDVLLFV